MPSNKYRAHIQSGDIEMGGKLFKAILGVGLAVFLGPAGLGFLTAGQAVLFGISALGSAFLGDMMGKKDSKQDDPGFLVNKQSTQEPIYVIYGERNIGGHRIFLDTTEAGGNPEGTQYLHMAFAFAEGEIEAVKAMRFNDKLAYINPSYSSDFATEISDHSITFNATTGIVDRWREKDVPSDYDAENDLDFTGTLAMAYWLGDDDQYFESPDYKTADGTSIAADMSWAHDDWYAGTTDGDSTRRGRGIAWSYMRLKYDRKLYPNAPRVQFEVKGRKVIDVSNPSAAPAFSNNPADCIADYISNKRFGKGLTAANTLDIGTGSSFAAYRQYCIDKGITFNGAVNTNNTVFDNVQEMMISGNAFMNYSNGVYKINPIHSLDHTGAHTFTKDNILGQVNIELGNKRGMSNIAKGTYFDKEKGYQQDTVVVPKFDETNQYLIDDNNTVNEKTFNLAFIDNETTAEKLTRFQLDNSRYLTTMVFRTTWAASNLEVGDPVYVTYDRYGYTNKKFRLVGQALQQDGTVQVTLVEYPTADIWVADV